MGNTNTGTLNTAASRIGKDGKLSIGTRMAYGCGDMACNVVYGMVGTLLTLFYTDYIGVPAASIALIMLLSRVFDGVSDFIMGFIVERTHSKWGQSRPWILWMMIPYALSGIAMFTVPQTTQFLQCVYIFVSYNACTTVIYTALNLPYGSLSAMMTRSSRERDLLSIFRQGMAPFGRILIVSSTIPLVKALGNTQRGWIIAMTIWCVMAIGLLLICFCNCKETVVIESRENKDGTKKAPASIGKSIKAIFTNPYFWACLICWMMMTSYSTVVGTVLPYYCKYILHNDTSLYSTLYVMETVVTILGIFACAPLSKKLGKRNLILGGTVLSVAAQIVFILCPMNLGVLMGTTILRGLGVSPLNALLYGMVGDTIEYGQWKKHMRQEGLIFSAGSMGNKVGIGIVSAVTTGLLSYSGYISSTTGGVTQPDSALHMISAMYKFAPLILFAVIIVVMVLYKLDKQYPQIMKELSEREARGEL